MLKGKTESGFEYLIEDSAVNNMELIDAIADLDSGNVLATSKVCELLLGKQQRKALYDHLRTKDGNVPIELVSKEIIDIFQSNKSTKN